VQVDLQQKKWSRREEADFLRTIVAYGVEYNKQEQRYNWNRLVLVLRYTSQYHNCEGWVLE
jgi:chromodomain-helicase-DNA-binding protein 7